LWAVCDGDALGREKRFSEFSMDRLRMWCDDAMEVQWRLEWYATVRGLSESIVNALFACFTTCFFTPDARLQKQRTELKEMKEKPDFSSEGFHARIGASLFALSARNLRVDVVNKMSCRGRLPTPDAVRLRECWGGDCGDAASRWGGSLLRR